jgi:MoxR-like ATPase
VFLTALHPDKFVDYRKNRWESLAIQIGIKDEFATAINCPPNALPEEIGKFAKKITETPTFKKYWGNQSQPLWTLAGICWAVRNFNTSSPTGNTMEETIQNILEGEDEERPFPLALKPELVKNILIHLESGKDVILVGAPGVGKSVLARRILKHKSNDNYVTSVAHADWTSRDLIGGLNLEGDHYSKGWMLEAIVSEPSKLLLIDEFNRADINKAFGEMFLAIESREIHLSEAQAKVYGTDVIQIPDKFRFIGTMNDFDKNLLLTELSYGLITRLAFVDVQPDSRKEEESVKTQIDNTNYETCSKQISSYYEFINQVREERMIGVRTSKDIISFLLHASPYSQDEIEHWKNLDDALCDYLEPQFDRLNTKLLEHVLKCSESIFADKITNFNKKLEKKIKELKLMTAFLNEQQENES